MFQNLSHLLDLLIIAQNRNGEHWI